MITKEHERKCRLLCEDIEKSNLDATAKEGLIEGLESSKEALNGLTDQERIQATAANLFWTNSILARLYLKIFADRSAANWKDVAIECKWAIVALGLGLFALLAFHPELGQLIQRLAGK